MPLEFVVTPPVFNPIGTTLTLTANDGHGPLQVLLDAEILAFVAGMPVSTANDALTALVGHVGRIKSAAGRALLREPPRDRTIVVRLCDLAEGAPPA